MLGKHFTTEVLLWSPVWPQTYVPPSSNSWDAKAPKNFNSYMVFSHVSSSHAFVATVLDCEGSEHFYHCTKFFLIKLGIQVQTCNRSTWDKQACAVWIWKQDRGSKPETLSCGAIADNLVFFLRYKVAIMCNLCVLRTNQSWFRTQAPPPHCLEPRQKTSSVSKLQLSKCPSATSL